jgi:transposase InsO family protein
MTLVAFRAELSRWGCGRKLGPPGGRLANPDQRSEAGSLDVPKGCSQDNAACEGFFGRLKTELFYPRDCKAMTIEQFFGEVDAYIRWYNEKRIKISLGSLSPVEYRKSLGLIL